MELTEWIESYRKAWVDADAEAAAALFAEDATYRSNIFEEPHRGRDRVAAYWREVTSTQSNVEVRMGRPITDGERVSVEFWTTMDSDGEPITLPGCMLLRFDESGLCATLHEHYEFAAGRLTPPPEWG